MTPPNNGGSVEGEYHPLGILPQCSCLPVVVGMLWTRIGGSFIHHQGRDGSPLPALRAIEPTAYDRLPQIAEEPHLQFARASEVRGAQRLVEAIVRYMDPADRDALWTLYGVGGWQ